MAKRNKTNQTLCVEEIASKNPILTEEDMNELCTYEEMVSEALRVFDEKVEKIIQQYDSNINS